MNSLASKRSASDVLDIVKITVRTGSATIGTWSFNKGIVTIGRVSTNDVTLADKKVSRTHCTIEMRPEGLFIVDAGSSNGTWINGQRITEARLSDRDSVVIAGFRLETLLERAPASAPWDASLEAASEAADSTPAEEDNVIPMRSQQGTVPSNGGTNERSVRTEIVDSRRMEADAKRAPAAPAPKFVDPKDLEQVAVSAQATAPRTSTMYVGGKKITAKAPAAAAPAPMAKAPIAAKKPAANSMATAPATVKVGVEKKGMNSGLRVALALGGIMAYTVFSMVTIGGTFFLAAMMTK